MEGLLDDHEIGYAGTHSYSYDVHSHGLAGNHQPTHQHYQHHGVSQSPDIGSTAASIVYNTYDLSSHWALDTSQTGPLSPNNNQQQSYITTNTDDDTSVRSSVESLGGQKENSQRTENTGKLTDSAPAANNTIKAPTQPPKRTLIRTPSKELAAPTANRPGSTTSRTLNLSAVTSKTDSGLISPRNAKASSGSTLRLPTATLSKNASAARTLVVATGNTPRRMTVSATMSPSPRQSIVHERNASTAANTAANTPSTNTTPRAQLSRQPSATLQPPAANSNRPSTAAPRIQRSTADPAQTQRLEWDFMSLEHDWSRLTTSLKSLAAGKRPQTAQSLNRVSSYQLQYDYQQSSVMQSPTQIWQSTGTLEDCY